MRSVQEPQRSAWNEEGDRKLNLRRIGAGVCSREALGKLLETSNIQPTDALFDFEPARPFRLQVGAAVGAAVARLFNVPPLPEGSDVYASVWLRDDVEVYEERMDVFRVRKAPETVVVAARLEDLARALWELADVAPAAPLSLSMERPVPETRPPPGEPTLRVPITEYPPCRKELCVYGTSEAYRIWVGVLP